MSIEISAMDRTLINALQEGIEPVSRPFEKLANQTGLTEAEIVKRIGQFLDSGLLTRFGPLFNADRMGGAFCLCAMDVPEDRFEEVAEQVNGFDEVAHNYQREHALNMWFVLATETVRGIVEVARKIEVLTGLEVLLFPKESEFYIGMKVPA